MNPERDEPEDLLAHADDLRRLARSLVHDPNAADDLVQDAWVEMLEGRAHPTGARDRVGWLAGLLRNLKRERSRGEGRRAVREHGAARADSIAGEQEIVERLETFRILAAEVSRLEEPYRSSIWQRFFEGRTAEEIAAADGVAAASVRARWMRALARLRERLDQRYGGDRREWMSALLVLALPNAALRRSVSRRAYFGTAAAVLGALTAWWVLAPRGDEVHDATLDASVGRVVVPRADALELADGLAVGEREPSGVALVPSENAEATSSAASAPLDLRLVDLWTGAPIPWCTVRLVAANDAREWTTDGAGRLRAESVPLGRIGLEIVDDRDVPPRPLAGEMRDFRRSRPFVHTAEREREFIVPVGPKYALDLELPLGVSASDLRATLGSSQTADSARVTASARVRTEGITEGTDGADFARHPWVRFGADARALAPGRSWTLRLASEDGRWGGEARVASTLSPRVELVTVRVVPRSTLEVSVADATGHASAGGVQARVEVRREDGSRIALEELEISRWRAAAIEPGRVHVTARALGLPLVERDIEITGTTTRVELVFAASERGGDVAGTLRVPHASARVDLVLRDGRGGERRLRTQGSAEAATERVFRFDDVPGGTYELRAESPQMLHFEPEMLRVDAPTAGLFLRAAEVPSGGALIVKARDTRTGAPIEHFDARIVSADGTTVERSTSIGAASFPRIARDANLAWSVAAPGWITARGDERALRSATDRLALDVVLERGASLRVRVVDDELGTPLANAVVLVDGVPDGATDEHGELVLRLPSMPNRLGATLAGRHLVGGDVDTVTGEWTAHDFDRVEMRLARREPNRRE